MTGDPASKLLGLMGTAEDDEKAAPGSLDWKVNDFLGDMHRVCRHYGMTLEPEQGDRFLVQPLDRGESNEILRGAWIGGRFPDE